MSAKLQPLLRCPFCGDKKKRLRKFQMSGFYDAVQCQECTAIGPLRHPYEHGAPSIEELWNKRCEGGWIPFETEWPDGRPILIRSVKGDCYIAYHESVGDKYYVKGTPIGVVELTLVRKLYEYTHFMYIPELLESSPKEELL